MITINMKRALNRIMGWHIVMLIFMLSFIAIAPPLAQAQVPRYINYQGKLTDANDDPVTGDVSVTIRMYDAESGGTALWTEAQKTTVTRGIFSILLGNTTALTSLDFNSAYWYSVEVESDGEMTPRQRLTSVGYAINADKLDGYDASQFLRADADASLTGALTVSGNITGSANGDITLDPTGTGNIMMKIDSTSGDFKITDGTTNWFLVDHTTGNVTIAKDLTVNGTIYGTLASTIGNSTFSSIVVTGTSDLRGNISNSSGAVTVADALTQTGAANQVTFGGNVDANNGMDVAGALTVSGQSTLSNTLNMNSNVDLHYSGSSVALDVTQFSTGPAAQFSGGRVVIGSSELTNTNALSSGELYVQGDLQVDGTLYGNIASSGTTSLGSTTLSSLTVSGASDLQGNISNSTGTLTIADNLSVAKTDPSTSGTVTIAAIQPTFQDGGTNSTTTAVAMNVAPTINYTGSTKTGSYTALKIAATETSLPTGTNYLIDAYAGAGGATQKFYVDNSGNAKIFGTLNMNSQKITGLAEPTAATDAATKNYADAVVPASAGGWTDGGTGVYLLTSTDNVGMGTSSTGTYKLNVSGSTNTTSLYLGGTQVNATAANLNELVGGGSTTLHTHTASGVSGTAIVASPSTAQTIQPTADVVPLTIKGKASGASNILSIYDSATSSEKINVNSAGHIYIAEDTSSGAKNSAATLYVGRNSTDDWEAIGYDPTLGTKGKYTFSAPLQVEASSPTGITFVEKNAQGIVSKTQDFTYDPAADQFSFSGGIFAQQFKNMVKNSSFEAFSAFETFHGLDPKYATGTFDTAMGGARDTTKGFEGGWQNFKPDEWDWIGGDVFQNSPQLFRPGYNVATTSYSQDYAHGKASVRLRPAFSTTWTDGEIKQTISDLKPLSVYSLGISIRVDDTKATPDTLGLVDIVNGLEISATLNDASFTQASSSFNVTLPQGTAMSDFPSSGILWIDADNSSSEQVSYTGKTGTAFTGLTRGINGTTAKTHSNGATITTVFKEMQVTKANASSFTTFKGQFITDNKATPVEIHLKARCTSATPPNPIGTVLFDAVQMVAGKSVPEYQPGTVMDSGDQTIYGALRIGRAGDEKGGVLSVDKFVRTRGIEFFTNDPGFTGQMGGFGGFGGINPPTPCYNAAGGTIGTLSLFTSGNYAGSTQFMKFYVQITGAGSPNQFKWYYDDGTGAGYTVGNSDTAINISTSDTTFGTTGVKVRFNSTTGGQVGDRWDFFATRIDPVTGFNSFGSATSYVPGLTRIYKDPDTWSPTYNKLVFEDSGNKVSITDLVNLIGVPSKIDSATPQWNGATANSGGLSVNTTGNYTGAQDKFYKIQIVSTGTAGSSSGTFKWSNDGGVTWSSPLTMTTMEQPIGAEGVRVRFTENPLATDPAGRLSDAYITGGAAGDTWGFGAHPATGTASIKTNPSSTQIITPTGANAANVTLLGMQMAQGQSADPFVIKDSTGANKFRVDSTGKVFASAISGNVDTSSLPIAGAGIAGIIPTTGLTNAMVSGTAAIATSKLSGPVTSITNHGLGSLATLSAVSGGNAGTITDDTITNADIKSDAAIATSKLSGPVTSITNHGLGTLATLNAVSGGTAGTITDGTITNADISDTAAISQSKLNLAITDNEVASGAGILTSKLADSVNINDAITKRHIQGTDTALGTLVSDINMGTKKITNLGAPTLGGDATTKTYVDNAIAGLHWKEPVLAIQNDPPALPADGDRYVVGTAGTGAWSGKNNNIAQYNGSTWAFTAPQESFAVFDNDDNAGYVYNGSLWVAFSGSTAYTWSSGLTNSGTVISVNYDDSTIGIVGNKLAVKAGAIGENQLANSSVTSAKIADGTIANADIAANAGISQSKLTLSISDANVASNAAIAGTKISPVFGSQNLSLSGAISAAADLTASDSNGTLYLGRDNGSSHYIMWNDSYNGLDSNGNTVTGWFYSDAGMSVKNLEIRGASPATITFGSGATSKQLQFNSTTQEFSFTGGKLKQAFQNLVRGGSFESWSTPGWYSGYYTGAYCTTQYAKFGTKSLWMQDTSVTQTVYKTYYISNWDRLQGSPVTLSVWARCDTGKTATASIGIGTDSNAADATTVTNISLTDQWQNFTFTSTVPTNATTLKVYLYASAGTNGFPDTTKVTENGSAVYYDGVTLVEGKLSLDYGPGPIFDSGDQVVGGSLAIGADIDPYSNYGANYYNYPRIVFGEPDTNFGGYYNAYGNAGGYYYTTYGGGTGEISFRRINDSSGMFTFNRPIGMDSWEMSNSSWNKPALFIGNLYSHGGSSVDTPDYAWTTNDAYIKGVLEVDGGVYGDVTSFYGGVGKTSNLLKYSEDFTQGSTWSKPDNPSMQIVTTGIVGPDGVSPACKLTGTTTSSVTQTISASNNSTYTFSVFLSADTQNYAYIFLKSNMDSDWWIWPNYKYVDLYGTTNWRRFSVTYTSPSSGVTSVTAKILFYGSSSYNSIKVWGAQIRHGSSTGIYIKTLADSVIDSAALFHGDGSGITNLSASNVSGTISAVNLPTDGYASTYVNVTGDTMTGALNFSGGAGGGNFIDAQNSGVSKFKVDTSGNTTIAGNLNVAGSQTIVGGTQYQGSQTITTTSPTAFLVENASGTDAFIVDTSTPKVLVQTNLDVAGTIKAGTNDAFQVASNGAVTSVGLNAGTGLITTAGNITTTSGGVMTSAGLITAGAGINVTGGSIAVADSGNIVLNTNKITLYGATGNATLAGSLTQLRSIGFTPDYENATLNPDGTDNFGTVTLKYGSSHNYYEWTTSEPLTQDCDIVIRYCLPDGFSSFDATTPIKLWNKVSGTPGSTKVDVTMLDTAGASVTLIGAAALQNTSWTESTINIDTSGKTFTPGGYITITIKMSADQGKTADVGELTLKGNW